MKIGKPSRSTDRVKRFSRSVLVPRTVAVWVALISIGCDNSTRIISTRINSSPIVAGQQSASQISEPYCVSITGNKFRWRIRYPRTDAENRSESREDSVLNDDLVVWRDLHLPAKTDIVLSLTSDDYVYSLRLPEFEQHEMAIPGLTFELRLHAQKSGRFELIGDEFCGDPHPELTGSVFIHTRSDFEKWLVEQPRTAQTETLP